ncbi:MAG: YlmC/YmxH family sporulation protein [Bacilli bacterium]|nr:YlmC/YmxH family sporulation protein [Bacilli bacterium]
MFLSDLQTKDIVNANDGKNLGKIIDVEINEDGQILNFLVEKRKFWKFFSGNDEVNVSIRNIDTIGEDVIIIKNS